MYGTPELIAFSVVGAILSGALWRMRQLALDGRISVNLAPLLLFLVPAFAGLPDEIGEAFQYSVSPAVYVYIAVYLCVTILAISIMAGIYRGSVPSVPWSRARAIMVVSYLLLLAMYGYSDSIFLGLICIALSTCLLAMLLFVRNKLPHAQYAGIYAAIALWWLVSLISQLVDIHNCTICLKTVAGYAFSTAGPAMMVLLCVVAYLFFVDTRG